MNIKAVSAASGGMRHCTVPASVVVLRDRTVHTVAFSPDGRFLATASDDGTVALRLLPIDELRELARDRVTRTLTDEECRQYLHVESC